MVDRHSNSVGVRSTCLQWGPHSPRLLNAAALTPFASRALSDWDLISIILVLYICVMLPLQLTFLRCAGVGLAVVDVLVDLYFIVDVILNFRTAVDDGGELLTSSRTIARRYLAIPRSFVAE